MLSEFALLSDALAFIESNILIELASLAEVLAANESD